MLRTVCHVWDGYAMIDRVLPCMAGIYHNGRGFAMFDTDAMFENKQPLVNSYVFLDNSYQLLYISLFQEFCLAGTDDVFGNITITFFCFQLDNSYQFITRKHARRGSYSPRCV